jgi:hypothetical protein
VSLALTRFAAFGTSLALALISACGSDLVLPGDDTPSTITIRIVNGDGQTGEVGERLDEPLEVEVTDVTGEPVQDASILFQLTSAGEGGKISPSPAITNSAGHAEARVFLGDKLGLQTGAAHVLVEGEPGPSAKFSALANPEQPGKDDDEDKHDHEDDDD